MNNRLGALAASAAILLVFASASAVAQAAPAKILADADVSAYAANFSAIQDALDALGDKYDDYFPDAFDSGDDNVDLAASFRRLREVSPPAEIAAIMKKNGLGDKGFAKFVVISYCIAIATMESSYNAYASQYAGNEQMMAYFDEAMKNVDAMKAVIHPADLKLVASRQEELAPLLEMEAGDY